jgi:hypothetical protein
VDTYLWQPNHNTRTKIKIGRDECLKHMLIYKPISIHSLAGCDCSCIYSNHNFSKVDSAKGTHSRRSQPMIRCTHEAGLEHQVVKIIINSDLTGERTLGSLLVVNCWDRGSSSRTLISTLAMSGNVRRRNFAWVRQGWRSHSGNFHRAAGTGADVRWSWHFRCRSWHWITSARSLIVHGPLM